MLGTNLFVPTTQKDTNQAETKIDNAAIVSWSFVIGSLLFVLDSGLEMFEAITFHSIIHLSASLLFTIGSKFTLTLKKLVFVAVISLMTIAAQFGLTHSENMTAQAAQLSNRDAEFTKLIKQSYAAWNTNKPENIAKFYAKDPDLMFFDTLPMQYQGWAEYQAGIQTNLFDKMPKFTLAPNDDIQTYRQDNLAWTNFTWHLSAELKDGSPIEADGRQTDIWEKRDDKWLIVHEHISSPASL